jgi:hypothetical protein
MTLAILEFHASDASNQLVNKIAWRFKMGPIGWTEISVISYHRAPRNIPEERKPNGLFFFFFQKCIIAGREFHSPKTIFDRTLIKQLNTLALK